MYLGTNTNLAVLKLLFRNGRIYSETFADFFSELILSNDVVKCLYFIFVIQNTFIDYSDTLGGTSRYLMYFITI